MIEALPLLNQAAQDNQRPAGNRKAARKARNRIARRVYREQSAATRQCIADAAPFLLGVPADALRIEGNKILCSRGYCVQDLLRISRLVETDAQKKAYRNFLTAIQQQRGRWLWVADCLQ